MIKIETFVFNMFSENTFVVWDKESNEAAVIDPGMSSISEEELIEDFILNNHLKIKYLINTHCHIDHILGCNFVKEKYNPKFLVPEKDVPLFQNAHLQASAFGVDYKEPPKPDAFITEEKDLQLGKTIVTFLFTPGHTPGEYCIYFEEDKFCITGDVLFREGIGRTDLWGGDYNRLIRSIETKLFTLPGDVKIYPGHGEPSTINHEMQNNPFLV
jgi:glyoxylase-like metal-dependent hydrolase (beta-lactamase superfamily II)